MHSVHCVHAVCTGLPPDVVHVVEQLNLRAGTGHTMRFIKVCAHRGEPLNELADLLAAEAAESDPAHSIALDQDPEVVYFSLKGTWVGIHGSARTWFSEWQSNVNIMSWQSVCCNFLGTNGHEETCI